MVSLFAEVTFFSSLFIRIFRVGFSFMQTYVFLQKKNNETKNTQQKKWIN